MGPTDPGNIDTSPASTDDGIVPAQQFLYLKVKGTYGVNLSTALFAKDVIAGMFVYQHMVGPSTRHRPEAPLNIILLSECKAVLELNEAAEIETHILSGCHRVVGKSEGNCRV